MSFEPSASKTPPDVSSGEQRPVSPSKVELVAEDGGVEETSLNALQPIATDQPLESVPVSMTPMQRFEEYLQSKGLRNTEQRKYLLEQVFNNHAHFDADQLIEQLPGKGTPNYVSRPTVYRTLREFVDAGLLHRFELDGRSVYEHDYGYPQHDHLYCTKCRRLIEFTSEETIRIREEVARQFRFRAKEHRFIINGVCEECTKKRSKGRRQDRV